MIVKPIAWASSLNVIVSMPRTRVRMRKTIKTPLESTVIILIKRKK